MAITGHRDGLIRVWNIETSQCVATLRGHSDIVHSIQLTTNQRYAVSGSEDKTLKIWDLNKRYCIQTLEGHQHPVQSIAIHPRGSLIASVAFQDNTHAIRLWEPKSGACVQNINTLWPDTFMSVAFSPDGSRVIAGISSGGMKATKRSIYVFRIGPIRASPPSEPARRYVNAKIVLIGESSVGKTTLAHRLIEDRYVTPEATHGMTVSRLDLPLKPDKVKDREALLWDLAGQADYRLIHQLYLEQTALALLLIDPQDDDPFSDAVTWLHALDASVTANDGHRKVAKLLVLTKLDVGGVTVSQRKIDRFMKRYGILGCLPISAKRGDNWWRRGSGWN